LYPGLSEEDPDRDDLLTECIPDPFIHYFSEEKKRKNQRQDERKKKEGKKKEKKKVRVKLT
jgi:hypothetical protein